MWNKKTIKGHIMSNTKYSDYVVVKTNTILRRRGAPILKITIKNTITKQQKTYSPYLYDYLKKEEIIQKTIKRAEKEL
jgi:hypothetical protein